MSTFFSMLRDGYGLALIAVGFVLAMIIDAMRRIWTASVPDFEEQPQPRDKGDEQFNATAQDELRVCTWLTVALGILAAALLLFFSTSAEAHDEWHGLDKRQHAAAGALIAGTAAELTGSRWNGFLVGAAAGVGKELLDTQMAGHTPSHRDAIVTLAGAALATSVPGLSIGPGWVTYRVRF